MKHFSILALAILAALFIALSSYRLGIRHAIEDSVIWTVDCYDPENPDESAWNGYDQLIYIELDNDLYTHGMYQG